MTQLTRDECIAAIVAFAEENPGRSITRQLIRNEQLCPESDYLRYFGTFTEFKKAAGLEPSRQSQQLQRDIAKHASVDKLRDFNNQKNGFAGKYLRPDSSRWQTALVISDLHDIYADPFVVRVFLDVAQRLQPDKIILAGDALDLPEFGKWTIDPRTWDPVKRFLWLHDLLHKLREIAPQAEVHYIEGNHEYRLLRHLAEASPALQTILADLHGWTVPKIFGLDQFEVNYHSNSDLAVFTKPDIDSEVAKNYLVLWDAFLVHHFPSGFDKGIPGCNGHHHHHLVRRHYSLRYGCSEWHQLGAGHRRHAGYCDAEKWSNGFLVVHCDTNKLQCVFDYADVRDFACVGGEYYIRGDDEF